MKNLLKLLLISSLSLGCSSLSKNRAYYVVQDSAGHDFSVCGPHRYGDRITFGSGAKSLEAYFIASDGLVFLGIPLLPAVPMNTMYSKNLQLRLRPQGEGIVYDIAKIKISADAGNTWIAARSSDLTKEECLRRAVELSTCIGKHNPDSQTLEFGEDARQKLERADSILLSLDGITIDHQKLATQEIKFVRMEKWNYIPLAVDSGIETEFEKPCHSF